MPMNIYTVRTWLKQNGKWILKGDNEYRAIPPGIIYRPVSPTAFGGSPSDEYYETVTKSYADPENGVLSTNSPLGRFLKRARLWDSIYIGQSKHQLIKIREQDS
jgi:hypothetical protein